MVNTVKSLSILSEGTTKINDECGKTIVVGKFFTCVIYRDQRK
jgi:hypothetical protein